MDLVNLNTDKIIIHSVPNALNETLSPIYSDLLITLDTSSKAAFISRLTDVLGKDSNCIEMEIADKGEDSVAQHVANIINSRSDETFIRETKTMANILYRVQNHQYTKGGILVCVYGRTGEQQQQYVALIKAEPQEGFIITKENSLNLLNDIFLTRSQKLYKVGFWTYVTINTPVTPDDLTVHVFDHMMKTNGEGITKFFSQFFLGCAILKSAAEQTKVFFDLTKKFIEKNKDIKPEEKAGKIDALYVYLKEDQTQIINPKTFAETFFDSPEIKDQFKSALTKNGFPETAVAKDLTKIQRSLAVRRLKFTSGVKIQSPSPESNSSLIELGNYDSTTDFTSVKIKGRVN